jgi:tRNA/rRNA methyltransferase
MSLQACRVVLVRPEVAANLGATARVMRNMGLNDLVLVSPVADPADREARRVSTHGEPILEQARIVADLRTAVADCSLVAATSAQVGGPVRRQSAGSPRQLMPRLASAVRSGPVALVFGPEPSGLTNEEVSRCHYLVHIPTDPTYGALNLAQSVAICLYELRCARLAEETGGERPEPAAPFAEQERMFQYLRRALEAIHYLYGPKAEPLMHGLRHLIGRAGPTTMEVKLLHGLSRQIQWYVEHSAMRGEGTMKSEEVHETASPQTRQAANGTEAGDAGGRLTWLEGERERLEKACQAVTKERDALREELRYIKFERDQYIRSLYALIPGTPFTFDEQELAKLEKNGVTFDQILKDLKELEASANGKGPQ